MKHRISTVLTLLWVAALLPLFCGTSLADQTVTSKAGTAISANQIETNPLNATDQSNGSYKGLTVGTTITTLSSTQSVNVMAKADTSVSALIATNKTGDKTILEAKLDASGNPYVEVGGPIVWTGTGAAYPAGVFPAGSIMQGPAGYMAVNGAGNFAAPGGAIPAGLRGPWGGIGWPVAPAVNQNVAIPPGGVVTLATLVIPANSAVILNFDIHVWLTSFTPNAPNQAFYFWLRFTPAIPAYAYKGYPNALWQFYQAGWPQSLRRKVHFKEYFRNDTGMPVTVDLRGTGGDVITGVIAPDGVDGDNVAQIYNATDDFAATISFDALSADEL